MTREEFMREVESRGYAIASYHNKDSRVRVGLRVLNRALTVEVEGSSYGEVLTAVAELPGSPLEWRWGPEVGVKKYELRSEAEKADPAVQAGSWSEKIYAGVRVACGPEGRMGTVTHVFRATNGEEWLAAVMDAPAEAEWGSDRIRVWRVSDCRRCDQERVERVSALEARSTEGK